LNLKPMNSVLDLRALAFCLMSGVLLAPLQTQADSHLKLNQSGSGPIRIQGKTDGRMALQASNDLIEWRDLKAVLPEDADFAVEDLAAFRLGHRYYRLVPLPPLPAEPAPLSQLPNRVFPGGN